MLGGTGGRSQKWYVWSSVVLLLQLGACSKPPDADQIRADLLGRTMGDIVQGGWEFESLSEFEDVRIITSKREGGVIEFDVYMRLRDSRTGDQFDAEALVSYRKRGGDWEFAAVANGGLTRLGEFGLPEGTGVFLVFRTTSNDVQRISTQFEKTIRDQVDGYYALYSAQEAQFTNLLLELLPQPRLYRDFVAGLESAENITLVAELSFRGPIGFSLPQGGVLVWTDESRVHDPTAVRRLLNLSKSSNVQRIGTEWLIWVAEEDLPQPQQGEPSERGIAFSDSVSHHIGDVSHLMEVSNRLNSSGHSRR